MRYADLHLHTFHSDGVRSPREVVDLARHYDLRIIAISDHDNLAAFPEARDYARSYQILVIPAVELSCDYEGTDLHLLAYGFDPSESRLNQRLASFRKTRLERGDRMVERLIAAGCPITRERVAELAGEGSLGRPHIARALVEAEVAATIQQAFDHWLRPGCPGYVEKERFHVRDAIDTVSGAGGLTSVAHPTLYPHPMQLLAEVFEAGAHAVEAFHPEVDESSSQEFQELARRHGKFVTGGSDDHGFDDLRTIGSIRVPESSLAPILDRL